MQCHFTISRIMQVHAYNKEIMLITGAELFVKALKAEQIDTLFAYPGGQAIDLFHVLYGENDIDVILPRHEQGLIHAADGYARSIWQ